MRRGIGIFVGKFGVIPPTQIEGIGVWVILWSIVEVMESISLLNSEALKRLTKMALIPIVPWIPRTLQTLGCLNELLVVPT